MRVPIRGTPDDWFQWLRSDDAELRHEATLILGGLVPEDPVSPEPLLVRLSDSDKDVVFWSIVGLTCLEHQATPALPLLIRVAATHPVFGIRQAALEALPRIAAEDVAVKRALLYSLRDDSPWVRQSALRALIYVPGLDVTELEAIRALEADPDPMVSSQVEITLRNIRLRRILPA
jgi:HEAT repeat protein